MPSLEQMPEAHIYQAYGIYLLSAQHRLIRRLKRVSEPSIHGNKAWKSCFLLMDYLLHAPPRRGARTMELGCGWGAAAVFCARHFNAKATGFDLDRHVFPYLEVIAALNEVEVTPLEGSFASLSAERLGCEHMLIGSDICFWDRLVEPLLGVFERAMASGVRRVVIADPGRPTFYELANLCARREWRTTLQAWYATDPSRTTGEVLEIRP